MRCRKGDPLWSPATGQPCCCCIAPVPERLLRLSAPISPYQGFPGGSVVKASASNAGDPGSIPGSGRSPGQGTATRSGVLPETPGDRGVPEASLLCPAAPGLCPDPILQDGPQPLTRSCFTGKSFRFPSLGESSTTGKPLCGASM